MPDPNFGVAYKNCVLVTAMASEYFPFRRYHRHSKMPSKMMSEGKNFQAIAVSNVMNTITVMALMKRLHGIDKIKIVKFNPSPPCRSSRFESCFLVL